jgi:hypothetical protein
MLPDVGGRERIRTAVRGFADLCLAARPRDPIQRDCKYTLMIFYFPNKAQKRIQFQREVYGLFRQHFLQHL